MNERVYRQYPAVNFSTLKLMADSPAHYHYGLHHPRRDTKAMALGRATHVLVFEPELFDERFVVWEGQTKRGNAYKAFVADHAGLHVIDAKDVELARSMATAVRSYPPVIHYLDGGVFETTLLWEDQRTAVPCKARVDWVHPELKALVDLKTTRSNEHRQFAASCVRYGYHTQMAHYAAGVEASLGWRPEVVALLAVESSPPHDVVLYTLDFETTLWAGEEERDRMLTRLAECFRTNQWPGRAQEPVVLDLPAWAYPKENR